jgi:hypothetical protein
MNKRKLTLWTAAPALALAVAVVVFVGPTRGQDNGNGDNGAGNGDFGNNNNDAGNGAMIEPNAIEQMDPTLMLPQEEVPADATTEPAPEGATTQESSTQPVAEGPTRPGQPPRTLTNNRRFRSRNATPQVDPVRLVKPMSKDFSALLTRDFFMKGSQNVVDTFGASTTRPVTTQPAGEVISPQRATVFNGVTESDATVALFEDTAARRALKLHAGDAVAGGKVTAIAFDSIEFEFNGKTTKVMIGQNLEGGVTTPSSGPAVYSDSASSGSSSGGGGDSILERMRRKRAQELSK